MWQLMKCLVSQYRYCFLAIGSLLATAMPTFAIQDTDTDSAADIQRRPVIDEGFVPSGDLFEPLWADPHWPQFRFTYNRYIADRFLENVVTFGIGETLPFWRTLDAPFGLDALEFGGQAAVFSTFDQDTPSSDQFNADFFGGAYMAGREGRVSGLLRAFHQSSHIGDEFLLNNQLGITRENFGYERFDLFLSYDVLGDFGIDGGPWARVYGGAGFTPSSPNPPTFGRWMLQWGVELRSPETYGYARPVAALNVTHQEGNNFDPDVSIRAGVQFDDVDVPGRALRVLVEYYNGKNVNGQFWEEDLQYVGIGIFVNL